MGKVVALLMVAAGLACGPAGANREDWEPLFNGRNLDGWVVKLTHHELGDNFGDAFRVENGVLRVAYDSGPSWARSNSV